MTLIELSQRDIGGIRAANPSPLTLGGTNSWMVGREPTWLIDPGPLLDEHVQALTGEIARRGGLGGILLTHDHSDHAEAVPVLHERFPQALLAAARGDVDVMVGDGSRVGPLEVLAIPGHAPDHVTYIAQDVGFTGDAVLGQGSVFISPDPGALEAYLDGLQRLRGRALAILCPGHGPLVHDAAAKLDEYVAHRLDRERQLLAALAGGSRSVEELLSAVWSEVPPGLRAAAALTLAAHLDKLAGDGKLPAGVERPRLASKPGTGPLAA